MTTPYWVQDTIFYQIFPDRFANGDLSNDPPNLAPWGSAPNIHHFQGGDLRGIIRRIDYLLDLGINAIYLNPIFSSPSNHRYNTHDFYKIDPRLGDMLDFHALLDACHRNNIRVILDGVFNHTGRGFFAFVDLLENGHNSAYKDWFHIHHLPLDAYGPGEATHYSGWWGHKSLPKLNTANPLVREYIFDIARYWIERGADGWRLDVPNEINDDAFWDEFRHVVKKANRDAYLLGEIWNADPRWANDRHFDGLMNYPVRDALLAILNTSENSPEFANRVEGLFNMYPAENIQAMYCTLGSHDTERIYTMTGGNLPKVKLANQFLFAYPGAPAIYYGDEIGLEGGKDPDNRRAFPWDSALWKADLRDWVRQLAHLRRNRPSLRRGKYTHIAAQGKMYAFARVLGPEISLVILNFSDQPVEARIPVSTLYPNEYTAYSLLDYRTFGVSDGHITVKLLPWEGIWLGERGLY